MFHYDELAVKAVDWSRRYYQHYEACQIFARDIALAWQTYLRPPIGRIKHFELDADLNSTNKTSDLGSLPKLMLGKDGRHHGGYSLLYRVDSDNHFLTERFELGIGKPGDAWEVVWNDQTFTVANPTEEELTPLFEALTAESLQRFQGSPTGPSSKPIGFLPHKYKPTPDVEG